MAGGAFGIPGAAAAGDLTDLEVGVAPAEVLASLVVEAVHGVDALVVIVRGVLVKRITREAGAGFTSSQGRGDQADADELEHGGPRGRLEVRLGSAAVRPV